MTEQVKHHHTGVGCRIIDELRDLNGTESADDDDIELDPSRKPKNTALGRKEIRKRTRSLSGHAHPYPRLDIEINLEEDVSLHKRLKEVARRFIPRWEQVPDEEMAVKQYSGGLTNKLFRVGVDGDRMLIRVYGGNTEQMIDRESEIVIIQELHNQGLSARFYGTYLNGCGYGHVEGRALNINDLILNDRIRSIVANHVGRFHAIVDVPQLDRSPALFRTMHKWIDKFLRDEPGPIQDAERGLLKELEIDLKQEVLLLEKELLPLDSPVFFCHNDLTPGNIIIDEESDKVTLIDHEYACFNFRGFELGNHFCEYIGFDIDMTKYPPKEKQMPFLRAYLESYLTEQARKEKKERDEKKKNHRDRKRKDKTEEKAQNKEKLEEEDQPVVVSVTEEMVERLYVEANKYSLASHLHWGIWGLAQARISTIEFDYFTYAKKRLVSYVQAKEAMLSLPLSSASATRN